MRTERFTLKGFQRNMLLRFIVITAIGGIVATILFYVITNRRLEEVIYTFHLPSSLDEFLLPYVITANLAGLLIVMIALILAMKSTFWKVAGPLFRVSQDIQKLIDGDLTVNIRLRKDDEFKDIAEDFDLMGKSMRDKFLKIKDRFAELSATAADMGIYHDDRELFKQKNDLLKKNIEELREGLDAFKI
ncbi:MAG: methyl-accepting chemotaxis protein [Thermodesulfovibrionales bacterium]|nr:methyl-accepting chemotaxis protein [Thermodesulfovibrionales bacterium]MDP3111424.1 methyl-accepting chemotaxis protein [Thermodesulfovibrionales bacterium]